MQSVSTRAAKPQRPETARDVPAPRKELDEQATDLNVLFGVHLRGMLAKKRLSAKQFHTALEAELKPNGETIALSTVTRWIRGAGFPNTPLLIPMAKVLGVSDYRKVLPPLD